MFKWSENAPIDPQLPPMSGGVLHYRSAGADRTDSPLAAASWWQKCLSAIDALFLELVIAGTMLVILIKFLT